MAPVLSSPGCLNISHHYDMRMRVNLLTITIPTKDRPDLLEKCLYAWQTNIPNVVVSDNSSKDHPIIDTFRRRTDSPIFASPAA